MFRTATRITAALAGIGSVIGGAGMALHGGGAFAATPTSASLAGPAAATAVTASPSVTPATPTCDDGAWRLDDGISVQGRPDHLDRGDKGATYVWHDDGGWHLRTTDVKNVANHYTGTVVLSKGASFEDVRPVMLEKDDRVYVDGNNVLHYSFSTYAGIDGFDFRVSACGGDRSHETAAFHLVRNGSDDDRARIDLGDTKAHPESATFEAVRTV